MERQFKACQTPRSRPMYLSIFNNFRVIRCLSQCVSPKIAVFTTFLFPLGTPLGQSREMLYGWKENSMLTNCLAACTHLSSTVFQLFEPQVQKIAVFTYCSPHFCFPWRQPCDYHAICCMDRKTIQCLPNPLQHLSTFNNFRVIRCLSQCVSPKIAIFTTFLFPLGTPLGNHAKCCMAGKRIRCLQIVSQHVPIYLQQFHHHHFIVINDLTERKTIHVEKNK